MSKLVYMEDGYFVFTDPGHPGFTYDFKIFGTESPESWVRHMSDKTWVTPEHIQQFRALAKQGEQVR